jgi:hypothetical protein
MELRSLLVVASSNLMLLILMNNKPAYKTKQEQFECYEKKKDKQSVKAICTLMRWGGGLIVVIMLW